MEGEGGTEEERKDGRMVGRRDGYTVYWVIFVVKIFSRMPPIAKIYLVNFLGNE